MAGSVVIKLSTRMIASFGISLPRLAALPVVLIEQIGEICRFQPLEYHQLLFDLVVKVKAEL